MGINRQRKVNIHKSNSISIDNGKFINHAGFSMKGSRTQRDLAQYESKREVDIQNSFEVAQYEPRSSGLIGTKDVHNVSYPAKMDIEGVSKVTEEPDIDCISETIKVTYGLLKQVESQNCNQGVRNKLLKNKTYCNLEKARHSVNPSVKQTESIKGNTINQKRQSSGVNEFKNQLQLMNSRVFLTDQEINSLDISHSDQVQDSPNRRQQTHQFVTGNLKHTLKSPKKPELNRMPSFQDASIQPSSGFLNAETQKPMRVAFSQSKDLIFIKNRQINI